MAQIELNGVEKFNPHGDPSQLGQSWKRWLRGFELFALGKGVTDVDQKRALLLHCAGLEVQDIFYTLTEAEGDDAYAKVKGTLNKYFEPKVNVPYERYCFRTMKQEENETIDQFITRLRQKEAFCSFDKPDEQIRDAVIEKCRSSKLRTKLLEKGHELTLEQLRTIASTMELSSKQAQSMEIPGVSSNSVHRVHHKHMTTTKGSGQGQTGNYYKRPSGKSNACYRCGQEGHYARDKQCPGRQKSENKQSGYKSDQGRGQGYWQGVGQSNSRGHGRNYGHSRGKGRGQVKYLGQSETENYTQCEGECDPSNIYPMHCVNAKDRNSPYKVTVYLNNTPVAMEVDTGASITVISQDTFNKLCQNDTSLQSKSSNAKLHTFTGEIIPVKGQCEFKVAYKGYCGTLSAVIVQGSKSPCLLGRDWLEHIKLDWKEVFKVTSDKPAHNHALSEILHNHSAVFNKGLGKVKGTKAKIHVDQNEAPIYIKARPVAYALRDKIEKELDRLMLEGTIRAVEFSDWATPIVPIVKSDGNIRICGDYKVTVNRVSKLDNYPIPKTEDLYATLGGGTEFTKLDLSQAYQQLELDSNSKQYTTINTHKGLFEYNRLPYGISSAPGIFQRTLENILQGIPNVVVRVDDILVTGHTRELHLKNLEAVLTKLENAGVHLKKDKCYFMVPEVTYLGHRINKDGIQPIEEKVRAIKESPAPCNVKELQSFLGMLNYYACYLPNLSTILAPLHKLLVKDAKWRWSWQQIRAWNKAKEMLHSSALLVHYDPQKDLVLSCDASPYGLGAVLSHVEEGKERPIAYASRTLAPAEQNYSQVDKEGASVIFGIRKFHQYLFGRKFTIYTDHKPLLGLLRTDKAVPQMASPRVQRWALFLAAYDYDLQNREGKRHANADGLSRLPLSDTVTYVPTPGDTILVMDFLDSTPVKAEDIAKWTLDNMLLQQVMNSIQTGWMEKCKVEELRPYHNRKTELSLHNGCIMWGNRVVIPPQGRVKLLDELHEGHPGVVRMKSLARSYFWWPGLDDDIECKVKSCNSCQLVSAAPPSAPLHPWPWPECPWSRLHIDYAGPFKGQMFLVIVDAYSKWLEVYPTTTSTSTVTIEKLRQAFSQHGLPDVIVSDNGTSFTSEEFSEFMVANGIKHIKTAPKHPSSNGLAERYVRVFKEGMKKMDSSGGTINAKLQRFLLAYRTTPQTTTGKTPAELLCGRKLKTRLDLIRHTNTTDVRQRVEMKQKLQKDYHDQHAKYRDLSVGDDVFVKNFYSGPKWLYGQVVSKTGPLSYTVKFPDGIVARRHIDQLRERHCEIPIVESPSERSDDIVEPSINSDSAVSSTGECNGSQGDIAPTETPNIIVDTSTSSPSKSKSVMSPPKPQSHVLLPRPQRNRTTPLYLKDYVT